MCIQWGKVNKVQSCTVHGIATVSYFPTRVRNLKGVYAATRAGLPVEVALGSMISHFKTLRCRFLTAVFCVDFAAVDKTSLVQTIILRSQVFLALWSQKS